MLLNLVTANLSQCSGMHVAQVTTWEEARQRLAEEVPGVLIFDLTQDCESHILPLLFRNPDLVMIGLDAESNQAVLVAGHEAQELTLNQIRDIVDRRNI